jgi:hypothetical protein
LNGATLYCDHDSDDPTPAIQLRRNGVDVITSQGVGNEELSDEDQLAFATALGRAIHTANRRDYARLQGEWARSGRSHAGIIIRARQHPDIGTQLRALLALLEEHPDGLTDLILYV